MTHKFIATGVARTATQEGTQRLEISFTDVAGALQTVSIPAALAASLASVLEDFAVSSNAAGPIPTKMPRDFAVGTGRYEQVVLVRFEDDAPYGLEASQAEQLGRALVEQAALVSRAPAPLRQ